MRRFLAGLIGLPLLLAVVVMGVRVGDQATFVTWPVVAFTALGATVAALGAGVGTRQPALLAAGFVPAIVVSYFLPAAPFPVVALVLVGAGALALIAGGIAAGMAAWTGTLMVLFVVLQGPAVECGASSVSSNSGPWWIDEPNASASSATATADGRTSRGTIQVADRHYSYVCEDGRLRSFERAGTPVAGLREPEPVIGREGR